MSVTAPWLALACDWMDSEMFDDSAHGHRLAWICLLCFAKAQGRAGRVRLRDKAFAERYRLSMESVSAMVAGATSAGAITVEGDIVTIVNWKNYQDPGERTSKNHRENDAGPSQSRDFTKTSATKDPSPRTKDQAPKEIPLPPLPAILDVEPFREKLTAWLAYKNHKYKPQGLASMVSRAAKLAGLHGLPAVLDAIERAMANNWEGWDQESSFTNRGRSGRGKDNSGLGTPVRERGL